ncbi:sporulation protein SsgA [Streptomyces chartreusis]|uniref:sporulation protein SsgA n=1 Tax=Streptomyces chartreusis TaxID=1969 RepID=UPI00340DC0D7
MMARREQAEHAGQHELAPARAHSGLVTFLSDKAIQHSAPFAVWLAEWPIAAAAHWQWGGSAVASAFLTLSAVGITGTTWWAGVEHGLKRQRLAMAVGTAACASGWFAGAAIGGATTELAVNSWLMGGPTIALAWAVKRALRTTENKQVTADGAEKGLFAKIGLAKARAGEIKASPNKVVMPVTLDRGQQTHDDAAKAAKGLAGVAGLPENAVRWEKDPEDAGRGQYVFIPEDMLKEPTPWPGPSCPGGSIADAPIPVGIYEDGPVCAIWFNGDEQAGRNAQHYQVMGMTGAGKSQGGRVALVDLMTRRDVVLWLFDPSKGVQTFGPLLPGADWALLSMKECEAGISVLPNVITARANWLGQHGYDQWTKEAGEQQNSPEHTCRSNGTACGCPGMPYVICWFEEVAKLFREGVELAPIAQEARSAGVSLVFSLQRSSHTSMDTDVRANIGGAGVFGTNSATDSGFALSDETMDAGARPEAWKNNKPGYSYWEAAGLNEERFATPTRTYLMDKKVAARAVDAYRALRPADAGPVTAQAAGPAYANRKRYDSAAQAAAEQPVEAATGDADLDADDMALHATDPEYADIPIDIDRQLPPVPAGMDMPLNQPHSGGRDMSREESLQALEDVLNELVDNGQLTFGPKDITPHLPRIGKGSSWVRREFRRLESEGTLSTTDETGVYRINVAQPV